jgi:cysteine synthase
MIDLRGQANMKSQLPSILDHIGRTQLVPLGRIAADLPTPVLGKCEHLNPGGSVKDRIALAIIDDAEERGVLQRGATIIEATAGNTGVGLALVAAVRGYALVCVMPEKMSHDKRNALATLGARIVITPNAPPHDPDNFQNVARRLAAERGWFLADQFANPANVRVHERTTGPEILEQCGGRVGAFVAGVGTGGTITGAGRFLKRHLPRVRIVLVDPVGSRLAHLVSPDQPDLDAAYEVEGIGGSVAPAIFDPSVVDAVERVSDEESFAMVGRLLREEGLFVGGTSGTAVVAAVRTAHKADLDGPVVAVLADSWDRYRSKQWMGRLAPA